MGIFLEPFRSGLPFAFLFRQPDRLVILSNSPPPGHSKDINGGHLPQIAFGFTVCRIQKQVDPEGPTFPQPPEGQRPLFAETGFLPRDPFGVTFPPPCNPSQVGSCIFLFFFRPPNAWRCLGFLNVFYFTSKAPYALNLTTSLFSEHLLKWVCCKSPCAPRSFYILYQTFGY